VAIVVPAAHGGVREAYDDLPLWYFDYRRLRNGWRALSIAFPQTDEWQPGQQVTQQAGGLAP
jgi:hypothetical protein